MMMKIKPWRGAMGEKRDESHLGMRVLVVDDDPTCLKVLEAMLSHCKYHDQSLYGTFGSSFYITLEALAGRYNEAADVWSAGVILYIFLSGMPKKEAKELKKIEPLSISDRPSVDDCEDNQIEAVMQ